MRLGMRRAIRQRPDDGQVEATGKEGHPRI